MADDVTLKLGGDADGAVAASKKAGDALGGYAKKIEDTSAALSAKASPAAQHFASQVDRMGDASKGASTKTALFDATLGKLVASFTAAGIIDRGIGMLASWGAAAVKSAGDTLDLSDKIGITTDTVQEMAHIAKIAEVPLESLTAGAQALLLRIERGNPTTRDAIERFKELGLTWQQLQALSPDEQFNRIITSLEHMEDPQARARMAYDLLGGKAEPVLKAITEGWSELRKEAMKSSKEQLQAVDDTAKAYDKAVAKAEGWFKAAVGWTAMVTHTMATVATQGVDIEAKIKQSMDGNTKVVVANTAAHVAAAPVLESYVAGLQKVAAEVTRLTDAQKKEIVAGDVLDKTHEDLSDQYGVSVHAIEAVIKASEKKTEADKQAADKAKQLGTEEKKRQDELFGRDLITRANQYVKELGGVENLTKLSKEQTEKLAAAVSAGLAAYDRLGEHAPAALSKLGAATASVLAGFEKSKTINFLDLIGIDKSDPTPPIIAGFERLKTVDFFSLVDFDKRAPTAPLLDWSAKMSTAARQLPQVIGQAFTTGGGWQGALSGSSSTLGAAAMGSLFGEAGKSGLTKGMSGMMGSVMSAAGPLIGALAGPMMDMLIKTLHKPEHVRIMQDVGKQWGVSISEGLAKQIEKDAKEKFGKDRVAGTLFNLDKIIGEDGGLSDANFEKYTRKLRDVFSMIQTGKFTTAEAAEVIDKNWSAFVEHGTDGNGRISASLKEIIALNRTVGVESKQIADWQRGQASTAIAGMNAVTAWAQKSGIAMSGIGNLAMGTFAAATASGLSFGDALRAMHPTLEALRDKYTIVNALTGEMRIHTDDAALSVLLLQDAIVTRNPEIIAAIDGLNQQMVAMDNLNLLNAETFGAMQQTGMQMYTSLQAAVGGLGGSSKDALMPMQGFLHQAELAAKQLGIPLEDTTALLIQQSQQLGIWRDTGKTANELLLDGVNDLKDAVKQLKDFLEGVVTATRNIPPRIESDVITNYYDRYHGEDLEGHARGYVGTRPHVARVSEGGRAEIIGDIPFMTNALEGAMQRVGLIGSAVSGAALGLMRGGPTVINIGDVHAHGVSGDPGEFARSLKDQLVEELIGLVPVGTR